MRFSALFLFCSLLFSCYYDNEEELLGENAPVCKLEEVTFSGDIEPIVAQSCAINGCHLPGGAGNGVFLTFEGILAKVTNGSLQNRVVQERTMPPNASLSDCEINKISFWINQGAPNN